MYVSDKMSLGSSNQYLKKNFFFKFEKVKNSVR